MKGESNYQTVLIVEPLSKTPNFIRIHDKEKGKSKKYQKRISPDATDKKSIWILEKNIAQNIQGWDGISPKTYNININLCKTLRWGKGEVNEGLYQASITSKS